MGIFTKRKEKRAFETLSNEYGANELLLSALLGQTEVTKEMAKNIPSLTGSIEFIANMIAMTPIKLYKEVDGKVEEVKDDNRIKLLNSETGDTLDSAQFWKAIVNDYFLGKGGYAYINKKGNKVISINYVKEECVTVAKNSDNIFKDFDIYVDGKPYKPYDFIKVLRKTKDGATGVSIITEAPLVMSVGYNTLKYENNLVAKGGNKRGFLKSDGKLEKQTIIDLKEAWKNLYSNNEENIVVLNKGIDFTEASSTSVEMQLNENKKSNSSEVYSLINLPEALVKGGANERDFVNGIKTAVMPVMRQIECALNKDLLLEREKGSFYYGFDTKQLTKGDIKGRYEAYKLGLDANFLQIDEVRYEEDKPPLGLDWIKLGLDTVLYNPKTKEVYTPNTNQTTNIAKGGEKI